MPPIPLTTEQGVRLNKVFDLYDKQEIDRDQFLVAMFSILKIKIAL